MFDKKKAIECFRVALQIWGIVAIILAICAGIFRYVKPEPEPLQILINGKSGAELPKKIEKIEIFQGGKPKLMMGFGLTTIGICLGDQEKECRGATYDILREKVSEFSTKNGSDASGTDWNICIGLKGIKWSEMVTLKDGKQIAAESYKEEQLVELLETIPKIWLRPDKKRE